MEKSKTVFFAFTSIILFIVSLFLGVGLFRPRLSGININANPSATVVINGTEVGRTPFRDFYKPGKYLVRLKPEINDAEPLDQEIYLERGMEFILRHNFDANAEKTSGYSIYFEKAQTKDPFLSILTKPGQSTIVIDGAERSSSPYFTSSLEAGRHTVGIKKDGFEDISLDVNLIKGYQLNIEVTLSLSSESRSKVTPTPNEPVDRGMGFVEIKNTPTGFLRIRSEASSLGGELGRALPGETFPLIGIDLKNGWFKIEFKDTSGLLKEGWISNQYAGRVVQDTIQ